MRWDASELCNGGADREVSIAPVGGPPSLVPAPLPATSAIAARAAIAQALPQRSAGRLIEEVQVLRVDRDGHVVAELQLDVRRERRDEVRACTDDAGCVRGSLLLLLDGDLRLDLPGVHAEVRHR